MLRPFELSEPTSVAEASELLARHGDAARIYAGGTELILAMKEGLIHYEHLVNVKTIPGLAGVRLDAGTLRLGAATSHRALERDPLVREHFPAVARMEADVANVRVREVGTLGGNLCFAEPHADPGTLLLVYDASVVLAQQGGTRTLALEQFFVGPFEVAMADDEILTAIRVPVLPAHTAAAYLKYGLLERPSVGVAVALTALPIQVQEVRIAVGCVGPTPRRLRDVESLLSQKQLAEVQATLDTAGALAGSAADAV